MNISRRKFLIVGPLAMGAVLQFNGAALGQKRGAGLFTAPSASADALSQLGWDAFLPFVNTDFTFGEGSNAASLRLVALTDTRPERMRLRRASKNGECFMMKFQGPYQQPLRDGTYRVNHFNLGDFEMFITDGGRVGKQQYYIAVVNRLIY